ncbi:MAG: hypothetical protein WCQ41_06150 [Bacillota bacterium]
MGIDRLILTCISVVVIIFIVVVSVELAVPISKNQAFNEACRSYLLKMEGNGGWLDGDINELEQKLSAQGILLVSLSAPLQGDVKFGETMTLTVEAGYPFRLGTAGLTLISQFQKFKYSKSVFCRRIEIG